MYRTDAQRIEDHLPDCHWVHSREMIRFVTWHTPPTDNSQNAVVVRRHETDDERSWGLDMDWIWHGYCYICEIDLLKR